MDVQELVESGKYKIIDSKVFNKLMDMVRKDIIKKVCSARDARYILDMSENNFYDHIAKEECLVEPSEKKGKYVLSTVYAEADRLNS